MSAIQHPHLGIRGVKASASLKPRRVRHGAPRRPARIRGVKASASLKPRETTGECVCESVYPRCKSLGLIEARRRCPSERYIVVGIRGVKASASLKQRGGEVLHVLVVCRIRGVKASASLKLHKNWTHGGRLPRVSEV